MSLLAWIVLGLIAGFGAVKMVSESGQGAVIDIVLGIVGAVIGGWLFNTFAMADVGEFNHYSLYVAVVGASALLLMYHAALREVREALFSVDIENQS
ncbi:GlsB/YeaQ/YmgE family stress response membrane protein [Candidatus Accumulibacter sp. ACC003]|uniref:GlsB/YeaQ/YmgE family stress response membrane protein n=1 Tax=Candidatus Accumulibacter sp. ACC003 TaxID=2823334 RepID=UPI0025C0386E|nr:GlsB/YeaQ/YmgE family stress response membrane protein [Candidatus Accumulibacter sp. ACC003]